MVLGKAKIVVTSQVDAFSCATFNHTKAPEIIVYKIISLFIITPASLKILEKINGT